ncbi:hypothetical protein [Cytobacillus sp. IB215665]|uniref:hypothetical protein n=1 Tax=Cytobacillus sp. IB215665 TaxID=3097357 RepID=UPI002A1436DA|nr:hypothetical protein [Cytobacillus sp. IB215665]MDX8367845.1 hypothetical protein [Cytobacillus sp. IB215665]
MRFNSGDDTLRPGGARSNNIGDEPLPTGERLYSNQDEPIGGFMPPIDPEMG